MTTPTWPRWFATTLDKRLTTYWDRVFDMAPFGFVYRTAWADSHQPAAAIRVWFDDRIAQRPPKLQAEDNVIQCVLAPMSAAVWEIYNSDDGGGKLPAPPLIL